MAKRVDANQPEIVQALRQLGAKVQHLHEVGKGCPDLLVGFRGVNILMEIKDGSKSPSKRRLTKDEQDWHAGWRGQVVVVKSVVEAHACLLRLGDCDFTVEVRIDECGDETS